jgi:hypothetical protein
VTVAASRGCCERLAAEPAAAADERLGESKLRRRNCERRSRLIGVASGEYYDELITGNSAWDRVVPSRAVGPAAIDVC